MAKNLKIIRFLGGEEIMAEVLEQTATTIKVKNPIRVVVMPSKNDPKNPQVGFAPYLDFSDDKETILNYNLVVTTYNPVKEFVSQYTAMFSGIVTPGSGILGANGPTPGNFNQSGLTGI